MKDLFSYAFRPFFLLNALFAILAMGIWIFVLHGVGPDFLPVNSAYWHGHEMLVGFVMAAIAGFILTAVATWTGRQPLSGAPLVLLVAAWLAGRLAMLVGGWLASGWVALADMLFPVLLIYFVAREVVLGGSRRNFPIVVITTLLALFNLLYHASQMGWVDLVFYADRVALYLLVHLALLLITVIAGRIIPNFSANWLRAHGHIRFPRTVATLERVVLITTIATGVFAALAPVDLITGYLAFAAALAHGIRFSLWRGLATWSEPLLFVLHAAYSWLPLGYFLLGCSVFGWWVPPTIALHALTMGVIAFMVLAVMTRVALAHTGRKLHAARLTVFAYWMMLVAVLSRVFSAYAKDYLAAVDLAAFAWIIVFAIFVWVYWPILTGPSVVAADK